MATTATVLQDLRANYPTLLDRHELRPSFYGLLDMAIRNTTDPRGIISADVLQKSLISWGRNVDIPVMTPSSAANGTGLACTFTGTEAISAIVNATYVTVSNGFEMMPALNFQNEIKYAQEFARKYTDCMRKIALSIDGAIYTAINTVRTPAAQYASSYVGVGNRYTFTADAMNVLLANYGDFFNDVPDIMAADDIYPQFDVILSTNGRSIVSKLFAQGEANSANTQYPFTNGDFDFSYSNRVTVSAASNATGFITPKGAFGIVSKNSPDCLAGNVTSGGHKFGTLYEPMLGITLDTLEFSACGSIATETGNAADVTAVREKYQFAAHYGILTPYTNFATSGVASVIRKFDMKQV